MTTEELKSVLNRIEGINLNELLAENCMIVIQVIDETYTGYWDYFYSSHPHNPYWLREFKQQLKRVDINKIYEIRVLLAYYDSMTDYIPYMFYDCLTGNYIV